MSDIQKNVEAASEKHSSGFDKGHLALPPAKKYLVLTCMDARIDPARAFGIELGDAHVVRNAGASAVEGLRSIVISQQLLGTHEIVLVKHTGCGMLLFKNEDAYGLVEKNLGADASLEAKNRIPDFLPFSELEEAVKKDIDFIKASKLVPDSVALSGWIYEVETGKTRRVV
ncbi:carbonate dehydratase [Colletotrichum tofieldiae]|uniref:Carbonic anhydrase n=1 Tax=Colletotrichum tofieldiae TaxID=708197 RepID=A0A161YL45_9PEZI|nr:carbonate dehydratase [Colletotrichum tofieldiae]GKT62044.1 carbonate dehydratase [Colletotrichum tofieldiae]GKT69905.1 carbonate dehydratase [Colletotrichum tofieldiae]GKT92923.1 carbonate dehydratase [Colletotrichum tofieldiae]